MLTSAVQRIGLSSNILVAIACVAGSAVLTYWIASWIGLPFLAVNVALIIITSFILKYKNLHPENRSIIPAGIGLLVLVLTVSHLLPDIAKLILSQRYMVRDRWIGISYLVFRLIHVLIDHR